MGLIDRLLTLLFPNKCFLCGEVLTGEDWLCAACAQELPATDDGLCTGCGKPEGACVCVELDGSLAGAVAALWYDRAAAHGIHRFKYDGRRYYGAPLAGLMADKVREAFPGVAFDGAAWVPMHAAKLRERGFCPALLLARETAKRLDIPLLETGLRHTGRGGAQMKLGGREARRENAKQNFTVTRENRLDGQTILLVDDVLTTGSTGERCAGLLRRQGAQAVYLICAATTREKTAG